MVKRGLCVLVLSFLALVCAYGANYKCPSCDANMIWTGKTKVEWGKMFYLQKCPSSHEYWADSASPGSSRATISSSSSGQEKKKTKAIISDNESDSSSNSSNYGSNYGSSYGSNYGSNYGKQKSDNKSETSEKSSKCPVCSSMLVWTGRTKMEHAKLLKIYKCAAGHECIGAD